MGSRLETPFRLATSQDQNQDHNPPNLCHPIAVPVAFRELADPRLEREKPVAQWKRHDHYSCGA